MDHINQSENIEDITILGNPRKPQNEEGREMLLRMNESHGPVTEWALSHFKYQKNESILDIGCGGGATLARMSENSINAHLTGVDYSDISVKMSKKRNSNDIDSGKMDVIEASVEKLPFADETFHKIITVESFYFWPDPINNLKEVCRILKKNGTFLLVADIYQKDGLSEKTIENIQRYDLRNPTKEEFRHLFEQAGFTNIQIHTKQGEDWICIEGSR